MTVFADAPYLILKSRPTFERRPPLVVGIPLFLEIFLFTFVTPSARLQLNDSPGILMASSLRSVVEWRGTSLIAEDAGGD